MAHDFNNLITGILLYSDLLLTRLPRKGRLHRHVSEVRAASQQGAALIQQLLTVARQEPAGTSCLSWNETIEEMRDLLARLAGDNIDLVLDLAPGLAAVEMDAAKMRQILLNLVLNARDAMPGGGQVRLKTRNCVEHLAHSSVPAAASNSAWPTLGAAWTQRPVPSVSTVLYDQAARQGKWAWIVQCLRHRDPVRRHGARGE